MEFSEYYVAYFDVLGYKEAFKKSGNVAQELVDGIEKSIELMKSIVSITNSTELDYGEGNVKVEYKIFSDNVLLCCEKKDDDLSPLNIMFFLRLVATIQRIFLEGSSIMVRGGVTKGLLYLSDDFVAGKALIDAVGLEESAVFPRILVDECVLNDLSVEYLDNSLKKYLESVLNTYCSDLLVNHIDGKSFLNYIIAYEAWNPTELLDPDENAKVCFDGHPWFPKYNPMSLDGIFVGLKKHKVFVEEHINKYNQSKIDADEDAKRKHILKKYLWMASFHNKICEMYNQPEFNTYNKYNMLELRINVSSIFNENTLVFDVSVG